MKLAIVSGSSRPNSQSFKISNWAAEKLKQKGHEVVLLDLHKINLPLDTDLNVDDIRDDKRAYAAWKPVGEKLQNVDGYLIVSPEWNGSTTPALVNFFAYSSADGTGLPLAHRPLQLFTVSSTRGGDYPVSMLKSYGQKNNLGVYIPNHVVIRKTEAVMNSPEPNGYDENDSYIQKRANHSLDMLIEYAHAFKPLRDTKTTDLLAYPYGM